MNLRQLPRTFGEAPRQHQLLATVARTTIITHLGLMTSGNEKKLIAKLMHSYRKLGATKVNKRKLVMCLQISDQQPTKIFIEHAGSGQGTIKLGKKGKNLDYTIQLEEDGFCLVLSTGNKTTILQVPEITDQEVLVTLIKALEISIPRLIDRSEMAAPLADGIVKGEQHEGTTIGEQIYIQCATAFAAALEIYYSQPEFRPQNPFEELLASGIPRQVQIEGMILRFENQDRRIQETAVYDLEIPGYPEGTGLLFDMIMRMLSEKASVDMDQFGKRTGLIVRIPCRDSAPIDFLIVDGFERIEPEELRTVLMSQFSIINLVPGQTSPFAGAERWMQDNSPEKFRFIAGALMVSRLLMAVEPEEGASSLMGSCCANETDGTNLLEKIHSSTENFAKKHSLVSVPLLTRHFGQRLMELIAEGKMDFVGCVLTALDQAEAVAEG